MSKRKRPVNPSQNAPADQDKQLQNLLDLIPGELKQIVEALPSNKRVNAAKRLISVTQTTQTTYSGPIPPAEELANYEKVVEGSASMLINQVVGQTSHRQEVEKLIIQKSFSQEKRGQIFAFLIGLIAMGIGTYLTMNGHDVVGGTVFGTTVVALTTVFIVGRKTVVKEGKLVYSWKIATLSNNPILKPLPPQITLFRNPFIC